MVILGAAFGADFAAALRPDKNGLELKLKGEELHQKAMKKNEESYILEVLTFKFYWLSLQWFIKIPPLTG